MTLDVPGLLPSEPMEQILAPQAQLQMLIDQDPMCLYRILERYGYLFPLSAAALLVRDLGGGLRLYLHVRGGGNGRAGQPVVGG